MRQPRKYSVPGRRTPLPNGQLFTPVFPTIPGVHVTRHHQGFTHVHPSSLSLTCSPGMAPEPLGLNPELRTRPLPATHVRAGTDHWTQTRNYTIINLSNLPHQVSSLAPCDLVSHP